MIKSKFNIYTISISLIVSIAFFPSTYAGDCAGNICSASDDLIQAANKLLAAQGQDQIQYSSNLSKLLSQEHASKLNDQVNLSSTAKESIDKIPVNITAPKREGRFAEMLSPLSNVSSSDILLDISPDSAEYIDGAVHIPYTELLVTGGSPASISKISEILGDAGISRNDSIIIYGECLPCGGGPSASTYVYWLLKYLGHDDVRVLDGGIKDWAMAGLPTEAFPKTRPKVNYTPALRPDLLASYDYVKNSKAQIIDARTIQEYNDGSITGSLNIPYDEVLDNGRILGEAALNDLFQELRKDKPVVVYTSNGVKASMVWFALDAMGYDARLYTWQDWLKHQPLPDMELTNISAKPNPVDSGNSVKIVVAIRKNNQNVTGLDTPGSTASSAPSNETRLTIKGCALCRFKDFPKPDLSGGIAKIGNAYKKPSDSTLDCSAIIMNSGGEEAGRVNLKSTSGGEFMGNWNADVPPGVYEVAVVASAQGISRTFQGVLEIEVVGSGKDTTIYKKLGTL